MNFTYKSLTARGETRNGTESATSEAELERLLRERGELLLSAKVRAEPKASVRQGNISAREIVEFTSQLAMIHNSGVSLVTGLGDLVPHLKNQDLRHVAETLERDVQSGLPLSESLEKFPRVFPTSYCAVVASGQESGSLGPALDRLANTLEWTLEIKRTVRSALTYPAFLLVAVSGLFVLLVTFLIPRLAGVFEKSGTELPMVTTIALGLSRFVLNWKIELALIVPLVLTGFFIIRRSPRWVEKLDRLLLALPVAGPVIRMSQTATFCHIFGLLVNAGVHSLKALEITRATMTNRVMAKAVQSMEDGVLSGSMISAAMAETRVFPQLVVRMIATGEQTGAVVEALDRVSAYYSKELPRTVKKILSLMEPILTVTTGAMVAFALFAAFMPMIKLMSSIKA